MDETEKLARWHDSRADFWRGEAIVKLPTEAAEHTAAAATIRAAMAEIERLRGALNEIANLPGEINPSNYDHDDACNLNQQFCYGATVAHAALKAPAHD